MSKPQAKGGLLRKLVAIAAGALAAKAAMALVEAMWTKGLRKDVPQMTEAESTVEKLAWIALTAAAVGVARELGREAIAPKART